MTDDIGKLERVPLREVWQHEEYDFTRWLQEHPDILSEALNTPLVSLEREQAAGSFSIDLVAEDEGGGKIIIENQLERSNHDHLGKLITYLTALNARTAVWIVAEPRPEHVAAVSWLNDSSSATFYLLKVEAYRIGNSPPAPLLTAIVWPAEEKSAVAATNKEFAERYEIRQRWWERLVALPDAKLHSHISAGPYSYLGTSAGIRGLSFNYVVTQEGCSAELYIDRGKDAEAENKAVFDQLEAHKDEIDARFGGQLSWERLDAKRACRIRGIVGGGYRSPEEEWDTIQARLVDAMNRLEQALRPHLNALKIGA